jgi:hypothetical protein
LSQLKFVVVAAAAVNNRNECVMLKIHLSNLINVYNWRIKAKIQNCKQKKIILICIIIYCFCSVKSLDHLMILHKSLFEKSYLVCSSSLWLLLLCFVIYCCLQKSLDNLSEFHVKLNEKLASGTLFSSQYMLLLMICVCFQSIDVPAGGDADIAVYQHSG